MAASKPGKYERVCSGSDQRFDEDGPDPGSCKSYLSSEKQCRAVKERKLAEAFETDKGRCLIVLMDMVDDITGKNIRRNPDVYVDREESEDVDPVSLVSSLGKSTLDHCTIADWHNFMYWMVRRRLLSKLTARKIYSKKECGSCRDFSGSSPHYCLLTGAARSENDEPCLDYEPWRARRKNWALTDEEERPHYSEELFEESMPDQETMGSLGFGVEDRMQADELYDLLEAALKKRILNEKRPGKREDYVEGHLLFRDMMELMTKGHSESDAKAELAKSVETENKRDSVRRRIDRYWNNTRDFLREEGKNLGIDLDQYMFPKAHRKEKAR